MMGMIHLGTLVIIISKDINKKYYQSQNVMLPDGSRLHVTHIFVFARDSKLTFYFFFSLIKHKMQCNTSRIL